MIAFLLRWFITTIAVFVAERLIPGIACNGWETLLGASLLLASDAGSFVTGAEIVVDGGFAAMSI